MWAPQHLMPPYGTPHHPYVMYPHGGVYAHPSLPTGSHLFSPYVMPSPISSIDGSVAVPGGMDTDGKPHEGCKEKSTIKRSKGSLGSLNMITAKGNDELGKFSGALANGVFSQSGESVYDGFSEGSDANSHNDSHPKTGGGQNSVEEASQNGTTAHDSLDGVARASSEPSSDKIMSIMPMQGGGVEAAVSGPTTNLNIGMDYWGTSAPPTVTPVQGKFSTTAVSGEMVPGVFVEPCKNIPPDIGCRMKGNLKGRDENNQTENLHGDPDCVSRRNVGNLLNLLKL